MRLRLALVGLALVAAGCSSGAGDGQATLWVTRDRGAHVLLVAHVPAGLTAVQALERKAKVETRYGGRYVRSIDGTGESTDSAWLYYVNGVFSDRGAAEYRLRKGDVEWWDYHRWRGPRPEEIVAGAFPEPLLHGFDGRRHRTVVLYHVPAHAALARAIGKIVHAVWVARDSRVPPQDANVVLIEPTTGIAAANDGRLYGPYTFTIGAMLARKLVRDPAAARFRWGS